jgi:hypothetical protein
MVRKKINVLRTACRRELKKNTDSTKSVIRTDIYVPSLWYFDDLDFLRHHEIQVAAKSTMEDDVFQETEVCANLSYRVHVYGSVVTAYGSNNRTGLEDATNTTLHGNQRLHVKWWKAPDDGHSSVRNM